jgi:phage/plasmid-like protein (TIGR03299 family)
MSFEIVKETSTYADVDQAFSAREAPWMKMGKLVSQPVTAREAAELGGLNFSVSLKNVAFLDRSGENANDWDMLNAIVPIPERKAVVADDDSQFMGFVSDAKYRVLQYSDAFDFMDTINPVYVAGGTLRDRRQGFLVVKPEIQLNVLDGEDPHDLFTVLRTSHDCTRAVEVVMMPLRERCMNQLTLKTFARGAQHRWSIKHTSTMHTKLAEAQNSLKRIGVYVKRFEQLADRLANTPVTEDQAHTWLKFTIPAPRSGATPRVEQQYQDRINAMIDLWQTSPTVAYAGTGWGLVNAVSEHYDWYRSGGTSESRFLNAIQGEAHKRVNTLAGLVLAA